ncbi:hypothetical protein BGZ72_008376, partial [Mortierella alpina]
MTPKPSSASKHALPKKVYDYIFCHKRKVDAPMFFQDLKYTERLTGHRDYTLAINHSIFSEAEKRILKRAFDTWKLNEADQFWSSIIKSKTARLSLESTETSLIENSTALAHSTLQQSAKRRLEEDTGCKHISLDSAASEGIGPVSDTRAADVNDISQDVDSEVQDDDNVDVPGCAYPVTTLKDLEQEPSPTFVVKRKKTVHAGNTITDQAKKKTKADEKVTVNIAFRNLPFFTYSYIQISYSIFAYNLPKRQGARSNDAIPPLAPSGIWIREPWWRMSFLKQAWSCLSTNWTEIKSNLPTPATYATKASVYLDTLEDAVGEQDIFRSLDERPRDPERAIIHRCVESWCDLYEMDPSPFVLESVLSEDWWMNNAWSGVRLLAKAVPGSYIITGEVTGVDSTSRRNNKERIVSSVPQNNRKKMGVRADMIWRTMEAPVRDWMIGEAARQWDENAGKYVRESTFKVPRQLHDILTARSLEVGGAHRLRNAWVTGMVFGGPVVQRVSLCWGAQGTNVTRFKRWTPARIYPNLKQLSLSLNAIRQLLLARVETLRLIEVYNSAEQDERKEKRAR